MTTNNFTLNQPGYGSSSPTWDQPLNANASLIDQALGYTTNLTVTGGITVISAPSTSASSSGVTNIATTSQCMRFYVNGTLTSNATILLPYNSSATPTASGVAGMWIISNNTTGSYTLTVGVSNSGGTAAAGATVVVAQGSSNSVNTLVYSDGVNVYRADSVSGGVTTFSAGSTGLTPNSATSGAITLAGTLSAANGGTGLASPGANGNVLTSNGTTWVSSAGGGSSGVSSFSVGTTGLTTGGVTTGPLTLAGTLIAANGGTGLSSAGTSGNVLTSNGSGWASSPVVSSLSAGLTGLTVSSSTGAVSLGGKLAVGYGGTGSSATPVNGQILIGNTSTSGFSLATLTAGTGVTITNGAGSITIAASGGSGTVTSVSGSGGTTGLTLSGGPITTSGTLTLGGTLNIANGGTGLSTTPSNGYLLIGNGTNYTSTTLTAGSGISITNGAGSITIAASGGSGTVTSVSLTAPGIFTVTGSPVTTSGTLAFSYATTPLNGYLLIGNGSGYTPATLTAGTGVTVTNGSGSISLAIGQSVATSASPSFTAITASSGNITATSGNIVASAGSITANTSITATSGDITATAGKVIAGNANHYLDYASGFPAWQVTSAASIYYQVSANKYFFNPSGTNGVLTLTNTAFTSNTTNYANATSWTLISDISEKTNISPIADASNRIANLKPVNFTWINSGKNDAGFIAQDFEQVYPQNVNFNDGKKHITLNMNFYADIISTIQGLQQQITELQNRLAAHNL